MTESNRAAWQTAVGGPENIAIVDLDPTDPGPGEARVRVHAAGLNPVDWKVAAFPEIAAAFDVRVPGGYGNDLAGVVEAVGDGVTTVSIGDRVLGGSRGHAVADTVVVPAGSLVPVPDDVPLDVAATLPIAGRTALAAVETLALGPDDVVLIGGAAGGVGVLAVQWAVRTGATVIGTASPENHDFLRGLGAIPVSYSGDLVAEVRTAVDRPVTAAIDLQGTATAQAAVTLGVVLGRIRTIAAHGPSVPDGVVATGGGDAAPDALPRILAALSAGELRVEIAGRYPLDETARAVALLRDGHVRGKLVILTDAFDA
ncbi:NADPH:quinone reductase-like Zn-dependent oxidoreductase [Microbacterium resistens]|uniref:NADPH:quinone reductase-like Zn-dependent oxidoreductase n=1 Tax=Microbacterium resistens TaxID=156977 RepID=A0ABU1SER0_9MICO|nr:NADP-dependent oxidoreductase [Microbacterium resistens]MDR6868094.1 NADPH:quinone reductase-like Zn-dependent oxidoreductase [Microbacterium resistens]